MNVRAPWPLLALLCAALVCAPAANAQATFKSLHFDERKEYTIECPVGLECDIQLEPGERVNDGFNAQKDAWDPHMAYTGGGKTPLPHLILRPGQQARRTNIIMTTTRRTYYLLLLPVRSLEPMYYSFEYDTTTYRNLGNLAVATQTALKNANGRSGGAVPTPSPTPADVADLRSACIDYNYTYTIDRYLADDHPNGAKSSNEPYPGEWRPQTVCSDGQHTYVQLYAQRQLPVDLPIAFALTAEGDTMINSTFNANRWRYTIDGVYPDVVLEIGSQYRPLRLRLHHPDPYGTVPEGKGRHQHDPTPVNPSPSSVSVSAATSRPASPPPAPLPSIHASTAPIVSAASTPTPNVSPTPEPGSN